MKPYRPRISSDRRFKENSLLPSLDDILPENFIPDCGPAERWQHAGRTFEPTAPAGAIAARVVEECVLDILLLQEQISPRQLRAALRFKADFLDADLAAHVSGAYNPARVSQSLYVGLYDRTDAQEAAYQRWRGAVKEMGELLCDCVISVVCHDAPPCPSHILPLQMGLIRLAGYYNLPDLDDDVDQTAARQVSIGAAGRGEIHRAFRRLH